MTSTASSLITLNGGLTVSLDALQLLLDFESRGCTVKVEEGSLLVGPKWLITNAERDRIRLHKAELLALVDYCETVQ